MTKAFRRPKPFGEAFFVFFGAGFATDAPARPAGQALECFADKLRGRNVRPPFPIMAPRAPQPESPRAAHALGATWETQIYFGMARVLFLEPRLLATATLTGNGQELKPHASPKPASGLAPAG